MDHTHDRVAQAAHIIRRIPSHEKRERIMQQLEKDGDFTAEELQCMLELVQDLIDELEHENARAKVDKLVQQWRDLLRE